MTEVARSMLRKSLALGSAIMTPVFVLGTRWLASWRQTLKGLLVICTSNCTSGLQFPVSRGRTYPNSN